MGITAQEMIHHKQASEAKRLLRATGSAVNDSDDYEEMYLRFPKSGGLDAVQYGPAFNGEFSWQFHPEYQAKSVFRSDEWTHLKIVVTGRQAGVYINHDTAALYVDSLRAPDVTGGVGIWSLNGAYFSNFTYRELSTADKLPVIPKKIFSNPNAIKEWRVSDPSAFVGIPGEILPENFTSQENWKNAVTEPDGYLNINKYAKKKTWGMGLQNSTDLVWLRYEWEESGAGLKPMSFEYGNRCFIYLNNQKLFAGNNSFLLKTAFFRGDIDKQMRANTVFLPVKKGEEQPVGGRGGNR